jgi:hypothetical protein
MGIESAVSFRRHMRLILVRRRILPQETGTKNRQRIHSNILTTNTDLLELIRLIQDDQ